MLEYLGEGVEYLGEEMGVKVRTHGNSGSRVRHHKYLGGSWST